MSYRIIKQIIYTIFYLLIFSGIVSAIYFFAIQPEASCFDNRQNQGEEEIDCGGPCESCAVRHLEAIRSLPGALIPSPDNTASSFVLQLQNPNSTHAAQSFSYQIIFYGAQDEKIYEIEDRSYLYASESKFITLANLPIKAERVARSQIRIDNIDWRPRSNFPEPDIQLRSLNLEISTNRANRPNAIISGFFSNNNPFSLSEARIHAHLTNSIGALIAASNTLLQNISAFEEKEFTVIIPITESDSELDFKLSVEAKR